MSENKIKEIYVLHVSSDVNYEMPAAYEDEDEAEAAAVIYVQSMYDNGGYTEEDIPRPETYADIQEWNDYWDTESDMQVHLIVVPFFRKSDHHE